MKTKTLREHWEDVLRQQADIRSTKEKPAGPPTGHQREVAEHVFCVALDRVGASRAGKSSKPASVVTAETGTGKSTYTVAFIISKLRSDPEFTAAMCLPTIDLLCDVVEEIEKVLTPEEKLLSEFAYWTSAHCINAKPETREKKPRAMEQRQYPRESLKNARFILTTHELWKQEQDESKDVDNGVTYTADGRLRDLVVLDESPELWTGVNIRQKHVVALKEACEGAEGWDLESAILRRVERQIMELVLRRGSTLEALEKPLVTAQEAELFSEPRLFQLTQVTKTAGAAEEIEVFSKVANFLRAASIDYVFYSRRTGREFVGYALNYTPAPNLLILDATGDIQKCFGLLRTPPDFPKAPPVDYRNLQSVHLIPPPQLRNITWPKMAKDQADEYVAWMRQVVLEFAEPKEEVLIVYRLRLKEIHQLIKDRQVWEGRIVHAAHWGPGAGVNRWKQCSKVFMFDEFLKPIRAYVAKAGAYSETSANDLSLSKMHGRGISGRPLTVKEGELLMFAKQMACRGSVRNIGPDGICGHMTLYATMAEGNVLENWNDLFPGAPVPVRRSYDETEVDTEPGRLMQYLADPDSPDSASSAEVAEKVGCKAKDLGKRLGRNDVAPYMGAYGWLFERASFFGLRGNQKYLVRRAYHEERTRSAVDQQVDQPNPEGSAEIKLDPQ